LACFFAFWKKITRFQAVFGRFYQPHTSKRPIPLQHQTKVTMKVLTEKQKAARKFASDYLAYLLDQEDLVERMVEKKWKQVAPEIELLVEKKIRERLSLLNIPDPNNEDRKASEVIKRKNT